MGAFLALVLSFFIPGLGQFYNGQALKGALLFFGAIIFVIFTGGILTFVVWIYGMIDAYSVANKKESLVNTSQTEDETKGAPAEKPENFQEDAQNVKGR